MAYSTKTQAYDWRAWSLSNASTAPLAMSNALTSLPGATGSGWLTVQGDSPCIQRMSHRQRFTLWEPPRVVTTLSLSALLTICRCLAPLWRGGRRHRRGHWRAEAEGQVSRLCDFPCASANSVYSAFTPAVCGDRTAAQLTGSLPASAATGTTRTDQSRQRAEAGLAAPAVQL